MVVEVLCASELARGEDDEDRDCDRHRGRGPANRGADVVCPRCPHDSGDAEETRGRDQPVEAGVAVYRHRPGCDHPERDPNRSLTRKVALEEGEPYDEAEHDQPVGRLLEASDRERRGGHVGQCDQRRPDHPPPWGELPQERERGEGRERGDGDQQADDRVGHLEAERLAERGEDRVGADRISVLEPDRDRVALVAQPLCPEQVRGEIVVDADPEDSDPQAREQGDRGDRGGDGRGGGAYLEVLERKGVGAQVEEGGEDEDSEHDRRAGAAVERADRERADRGEEREPDDGLEPGGLAAAEHARERPPDDDRGENDDERAGVGREQGAEA